MIHASYVIRLSLKCWGRVRLDRRVGFRVVGGTGWLDALIVLLVFLIAVLHGDALHAPLSDRGSGFLQGQPVPYRIVPLAVQCRVKNALQPKISVFLLQEWEISAGIIHTIRLLCPWMLKLNTCQTRPERIARLRMQAITVLDSTDK